ncbi:hypothetical protein MIR68_010515 [Amoeboaphelidium protococcarum]|nr:hypothetical protein MIR68_010515 [Amoeboaphelidium protococcarum]
MDSINNIPSSSDKGRVSIKFIGRPPASFKNNDTQPGHASSKEAHILNMISFPLNDNVTSGSDLTKHFVDDVDAGNEDPFSLESFEGLINAHHKAGKDFLIARVITMTPQTYDTLTNAENYTISADGSKTFIKNQQELSGQVYKSYYAAHQINRSLFRTQPEEGLLHRMKAKNPMNNLNIVGDVHYFVVKCPQNQQAQSGSMTRVNTAADPLNASGNGIANAETASITSSSSMPNLNSETAIDGDLKRNSSSASLNLTMDTATTTDKVRSDSQNTLVNADINVQDNAQTQEYTAQFYATDDDFLMRRHIREYFKQNAMSPEDVFLFTLFGSQQQNLSTQSGGGNGPLVSDPTNPNAVAMTMEEAILMYQREQENRNRSSADVLRSNHATDGSRSGRERSVSMYARLESWLRERFPNVASIQMAQTAPNSPSVASRDHLVAIQENLPSSQSETPRSIDQVLAQSAEDRDLEAQRLADQSWITRIMGRPATAEVAAQESTENPSRLRRFWSYITSDRFMVLAALICICGLIGTIFFIQGVNPVSITMFCVFILVIIFCISTGCYKPYDRSRRSSVRNRYPTTPVQPGRTSSANVDLNMLMLTNQPSVS